MKNSLVLGAGVAVGAAAMVAMRLTAGGVSVGVTYADMPLATKIEQAPVIVTGTVADISPTRWNQDDGTFWETVATDALGQQTVDSAVPYHTVVLQVDRPLADRDGVVTDKLALTIVGGGDLDGTAQGVTALAGDTITGRVGDRVIAFVRPGQLAWRDGSAHAVLVPMGAPGTTVVSEAAVNAGAFPGVTSFDALVAQVGRVRSGGATTD